MKAYALTDVGKVRAMNQDYIYSSPEPVGSLPNLFLVYFLEKLSTRKGNE